jgi:MerR family transcriptional regulator, repressor of the yfmOP operon
MTTALETEDREALRTGEVAERLGTTPRTVRYYEEVELLPPAEGRAQGKHRTYTEADVDHLRRILELKRLLGLSLDELKEVVEADEARAVLRARFERTADLGERRRLVVEALEHVDRQLALVRERHRELARLDRELSAKRTSLRRRLRELDGRR